MKGSVNTLCHCVLQAILNCCNMTICVIIINMANTLGNKVDMAAQEIAALYLEHVDSTLPFGTGHINDTYLVNSRDEKFILQRLNPSVFRRPDYVMENIARVTGHIKRKLIATGGDPQRETLTLLPARDGRICIMDEGGGVWRLYPYIENTCAYENSVSPSAVESAAECFGRFALLLDDFPTEKLHTTLPGFHNTVERVETLERAARQDVCDRFESVRNVYYIFMDRTHIAREFCRVCGDIAPRATHNDTKLSNVLFDKETDKAVCVIDLDTVMQGCIISDYGDGIRSCAAASSEDSGTAVLDAGLFSAFSRGYIRALGGVLTQAELSSLLLGAFAMIYENGVRFLTDYLMGDIYFKVNNPKHNLTRALNQLGLLCDAEAKQDELKLVLHGIIFSSCGMR